jgi:beta-lactamase regulating signal transducer with metallopeptidase domain
MSHLPTTGLSLLAQSTLLLCLGLCAAHVLRSRGPTIRAFVLQMTLLGIALGSILSVSLAGHIRPVWQMPVRMVPTLPNNGGAWHAMPLPLAATPIAIPLAVDHSASAFPVPTLLASPDKTKPFTAILPRLIADLWLAGAGLLLLWLAVCQIRLILLRGHAVLLTTGRALDALARLDAGQSRSMPLLLSSPHIRSPFLAGIVRPAIFLPATWDTDYDDATLHVIFAHELAHRQRQDCAWTLLLRLTSTLLWPQPLLWLLGRQLEQATEEACDLMALTPDCPPRRYADCLLALAERSSPHRLERTFGAGVTPIRSALGRRILNVLDRRNLAMSHLSNRLRVCVTLAATAVATFSVLFISAGAVSVSPNRAITVVQQYLNARSSENEDAAYALLSSATRSTLPQNPYTLGDNFARHFTDNSSNRYTVVGAFFFDTHNTLGAKYTVIGAVPGNPNLVQVSVLLPGIRTPVFINVGVFADKGSKGELKIDEGMTFRNTDVTAYQKLREQQNQVAASEHLRIISLCITQYAMDHHEFLPDAKTWVDEISPYLINYLISPNISGAERSRQYMVLLHVTGTERRRQLMVFLHDPSASAGQTWSYAYNRALSHLPLSKINVPAQVIELFTSTLGVINASDTGQSLPIPGWHTGGNLYAFVDTHVKWVRNPTGYRFSFLPSFSG